MSFLKDFHITEQRARGIRTIRDSLRAAGLPEPVFNNSSISFRVTLYNSAFMSSEEHEWLRQFKKFGLNERQLTALNHLHSSGDGLSNSEYRALNNMNSVGDDRRANYELNRLVEIDIVATNGARRNRRYYLDV
jgi:predicted HTH transcriptional regulator